MFMYTRRKSVVDSKNSLIVNEKNPKNYIGKEEEAKILKFMMTGAWNCNFPPFDKIMTDQPTHRRRLNNQRTGHTG